MSNKLTKGQSEIMRYIREHGKITKAQAVQLIGGKYYYNAPKHVGDVLSRMVKSGLLRRESRGIYVMAKTMLKNPGPDTQDKDQMKLF